MPRRPDLPCAGCGTLLWRGSTSLPAGEARCRACRKADRCGTANGYQRGCRCDRCTLAKTDWMRGYAADRKSAGRPIVYHPERPEKAPCVKCGKRISSARSPRPHCRSCRRSISISKAVRLSIYERDGWACGICGDPIDRLAAVNDRWAATLDHILPRSLGGPDSVDNLRTAHRFCNTSRSNRVEVA